MNLVYSMTIFVSDYSGPRKSIVFSVGVHISQGTLFSGQIGQIFRINWQSSWNELVHGTKTSWHQKFMEQPALCRIHGFVVRFVETLMVLLIKLFNFKFWISVSTCRSEVPHHQNSSRSWPARQTMHKCISTFIMKHFHSIHLHYEILKNIPIYFRIELLVMGSHGNDYLVFQVLKFWI